jgi:hypothetical protein
MADVGVWMAPSVLEHKLDDADRPTSTETTWNVARFPQRIAQEPPPHRLFVACGGVWRGYFRLLPEVLWNPEDEKAPYALIFDAASWVEIRPVPVRRFRGFTYEVPEVPATARKPACAAARDVASERVRAARERILAARKRDAGAKEGASASHRVPGDSEGGRTAEHGGSAGNGRAP